MYSNVKYVPWIVLYNSGKNNKKKFIFPIKRKSKIRFFKYVRLLEYKKQNTYQFKYQKQISYKNQKLLCYYQDNDESTSLQCGIYNIKGFVCFPLYNN